MVKSASKYMKYHIVELRRKIWRHDWSSQSKPSSLKKIYLWPAPSHFLKTLIYKSFLQSRSNKIF